MESNSRNDKINPAPKELNTEQRYAPTTQRYQEKVENYSTKEQSEKRLELGENNTEFEDVILPTEQKREEQTNTIITPSAKVHKAQNRNIRIEDMNLEEHSYSKNNLITKQTSQKRNYQIFPRTTNPTQQQNLETSSSLFNNFRNFLTGVGKAANQIFG